jgi:hypothetical protein
MTTTEIDTFAVDYAALWTERDPSVRRQAIEKLWAEDGVEHTGVNDHRGYDAIERRVTAAHKELFETRENLLQLADTPVAHDDSATFTLQIVPAAGGPATWTGRIFLLFDDQHRIAADHQFDVTSQS